MNVGGSIETLEKALDEIASYPSRGPRDDVVKDILKRLQCVESFQEFADMMHQAAIDADGDDDDDGNHAAVAGGRLDYFRNDLLVLGFEEDLVDAVLQATGDDETLESLVMKLSELQAGSSSPARSPARNLSNAAASSPAVHRALRDDKLSSPERVPMGNYNSREDKLGDDRSPLKSENEELGCLRQLSRELQDAVETGQMGDWENQQTGVNDLYAKFIMASSLVHSEEAGTISDDGVMLLQWAGSLLELWSELQRAYQGGEVFATVRSRHKGGLLAWYFDLEKMRKHIDEEFGSENALLSDKEMERMAELQRIAAMGTDDEQLLHSLIMRHEEVLKETGKLHKKFADMTSYGSDIRREQLEELYLYLKELVASGAELESVADELHDHVYAVVASAKGPSIVNFLLDLHILEDEQIILSRRIRELTDPSLLHRSAPGEKVSSGHRDGFEIMENGGIGQRGEDARGVNLLWADEKQHSGGAGFAEAGRHPYGQDDAFAAKGIHADSSHPGERLWTNADAKIAVHNMGNSDSKSQFESSSGGGATGGVSAENVNRNGDLSLSGQNGKGALSSSGDARRGNRGAIGEDDSAEKDAYLNSLKSKHRTALQNLQDGLETERSRRLQELEDKLMRKKLARKKELASAEHANDTAEELAQLTQSLLAGEARVEQEITETNGKFDNLKDGLTSGFKKRCVSELKAVKAKGGQPLTSEEERDCFRDAADALKKRFERDQKALLESLEAERNKQKQKILKSLAKKKQAVVRDSEHSIEEQEIILMGLDEEARESIRRMNQTFDEQETEALRAPHREALLALSAINMDTSLFDPDANGSKDAKGGSGEGEEEEEQEDYLDDGKISGSAAKKARAWLNWVDNTNETYLQAGDQLQAKLQGVHRASLDDVDLHISDEPEEAATEGGFSNVTAHMMNVITEAFSNQLEEFDVDKELAKNSASRGNEKKNKLDSGEMNRIKMGIMEEFEKSRDGYNEALERARLTSKSKLEKRKKTKPSGAEHKDGSEDEVVRVTRTQAMLEEVVDSFLEEPIVIPAKPVMNRSASSSGLAGSNENSPNKKKRLPFQAYVAAVQPSLLPSLISNRSGASSLPTNPKTPYSSALGSSTPANNTHPIVESKDEHLDQRDRIKAAHEEKEKILVDQLRNQMMAKKQQLEDRLRKKKDQRARTLETIGAPSSASPSDSGLVGERELNEAALLQEEEEVAQEDVNRLDQAFQNVVNMVKTTDSVEINQLDMQFLMDAMERMMRGEKVTSLVNIESIPGGGGGGSSSSHAADMRKNQMENEERAQMQDEVRRISMAYNEEKQKLDLMMKIQQARQRQILQRKLLERQQQQQQQQQQLAGTQQPKLIVPPPNKDVIRDASGNVVVRRADAGHAGRGMNLAPFMKTSFRK